MQTSLVHLPEAQQKELARIKEIILEDTEAIEMIFLFGGYAKGACVAGCHVETTYTYINDFDILVVTQNAKIAQYSLKWNQIRAKINDNACIGSPKLIVYSIHFVNAHLNFLVEILNQGILLYERCHYTLAKPQSFLAKQRQQKAQDYFDDWFISANSFFEVFNFYLSEQAYNKAAFNLHQAIKRYYTTFLLVFTDYQPTIHDLQELNAQVSQIKPIMRKVFPQATDQEKHCLERLRSASIDARYPCKHYSITKEELEYLGERVNVLRDMTEQCCKVQIESLGKAKQ